MTSPIRILIIEDDADYISMLELTLSQLRDSYVFEFVDTYAAGLDAVMRGTHDVYLVDYLLDLGNTGDSLIDEAVRRDYPVIILTGVEDTKLRERMLRAGASDYIIKSDLNSKQLDQIIYKALNQE